MASGRQNLFSSMTQSRRVIVVLSSAFLSDPCWPEVEDVLACLTLSSSSSFTLGVQRKRLIAVLLDDCLDRIPDVLRLEAVIVDARDSRQDESILAALHTGSLQWYFYTPLWGAKTPQLRDDTPRLSVIFLLFFVFNVNVRFVHVNTTPNICLYPPPISNS